MLTAAALVQALTQALYLTVFVLVAVRAVRRPRWVVIDTALLFGATAALVTEQLVRQIFGLEQSPLLGALSGALLMLFPYLLLRLLNDFAGVPRWLMWATLAGWVAAAAGLVIVPGRLPPAAVLAYVVYFAGLMFYATARFLGQAGVSVGVTRRRMQSVAVGSGLLGVVILAAGLRSLAPMMNETWALLGQVAGLGSGIAYALGFVPPLLLRRAWQEPEVRRFLGRTAGLARLPDEAATVAALEEGAAAAVGAPAAVIGLYQPREERLRFRTGRLLDAAGGDALAAAAAGLAGVAVTGEYFDTAPDVLVAGESFRRQQALFVEDAARHDPAHAAIYRATNVTAVLAAPITIGDTCIGVLCVYAPRAPIFAEDDLDLVRLLADQSAIVIESWRLLDAAARMRAREEAGRLKDDFLSAAAHDLKTPLTSLSAQAQLLERRALRDPVAPADLAGLRRLVDDARRMTALVHELLDASRLAEGRLTLRRERVDLGEVAEDVCGRLADTRHDCTVEVAGRVTGSFDRVQVAQLLTNLVENGIKYSPNGGALLIRVWEENGEARLSVTDNGIGIPAADLPRLFERFHRGANVDDRRFAGMGLGLFISRGIVEAHGGRIWAESVAGRGSTFHVALPVSAGETEHGQQADPGR